MKKGKGKWTALRYLVIAGLGVLFLVPFVWMLVSSVKDPLHVFTRPIQWIPDKFHFENYTKLFTQYHFEKYVWNTIKLCLLNVIGAVFSCSLTAYGFAFCKYRHKNKFFLLLLITMMISGTITFFPQFILFANIGWYGTLFPLWVPSFFAGSAYSVTYYVFFLRQYFLTIPTAMLESAKLDGCGSLKSIWHIVMPMARPVYIVMILNVFIAVWGDFFNQLIYITRKEQYTISIGLSYLNSSYGSTSNSTIPILMAGSVVVSLPILLVYYMGQRTMVKGYVFRDVGK